MDYEIISNYNGKKNVWEVVLKGEYDIFNFEDIKTKLNEIISQKEIDIYIDGTNLMYMDSTAIGALVSVLKNVKLYNGKIVLKNIKPNLLKLFRITNLDKIFVIEGGLDE